VKRKRIELVTGSSWGKQFTRVRKATLVPM